jgi:hypothetical protein
MGGQPGYPLQRKHALERSNKPPARIGEKNKRIRKNNRRIKEGRSLVQ